MNGGVVEQNVGCAPDDASGVRVLTLAAHGDMAAAGEGQPPGLLADGGVASAADGSAVRQALHESTLEGGITVISDGATPRDANTQFDALAWALPGYYMRDCRPHCGVRRVGGAVRTVDSFSSGLLTVRYRSCKAPGVTSALWIGERYLSADCATSPSHLAALDAFVLGRQSSPCHAVTDGGLVEPVSDGDYHTYTCVTRGKGDLRGTAALPPRRRVAGDGARAALAHAGARSIRYMWDSTGDPVLSGGRRRSVLYVDGRWSAGYTEAIDGGSAASALSEHDARFVPEAGRIYLGAWIPNAWAGSPAFDSCEMSVESLLVRKLEAGGGRWCEWEKASAPSEDAVTCSSHADCKSWVTHNCLRPLNTAFCQPWNGECLFKP